MALAVSCSRPEEPLVIPDLEEVPSVKAFHQKDEFLVWEREIRDPKQIDTLLTHFRNHNSGYHNETRLREWFIGSRYDGPHEYKIIFGGKGSSPEPLVIWIGPDWLCGMDFQRGKPWLTRYRRLSTSELEEILAIIVDPAMKQAG